MTTQVAFKRKPEKHVRVKRPFWKFARLYHKFCNTELAKIANVEVAYSLTKIFIVGMIFVKI